MSGDFDSISSDDLRPPPAVTEAMMLPGVVPLTEREDVSSPEGDLESVIGDDDRKRVTNTTAEPWRHICALKITFPMDVVASGTGWFISPRTIITAGHCLYDLKRFGGAATKIEVTPARDGDLKPFKSKEATNFRTLRGWVNGQRDKLDYLSIHPFDYGAILLDEPFDGLGYFSFGVIANDAALKSQDANIAGYPFQERDVQKNGDNMFWHARPITNATPTILEYDVDTAGGQSGSPIWLKMGANRYAVGIHTRGVTATEKLNGGVRITPEVFATMKAWKELGQ